MKYGYLSLLFVLLSLTSCSLLFSEERTPETILAKVWGVDVSDVEHNVRTFHDQWCPNGDGETIIVMDVVLGSDDIEQLKAKGAKPLPIPDDAINKWGKLNIESKIGVDNASEGYYIYKQLQQELECKFLMYDSANGVLYYYISIM